MTKVDEACPLVAEDLKNIYRSVYIQRKVTYQSSSTMLTKQIWKNDAITSSMCISPFQARELSDNLGIPLSCVLPVKNYSEELDLDQNTDVLLLAAVEQMLNYADSFFENQPLEDHERNDQADLYQSSELHCPDF